MTNYYNWMFLPIALLLSFGLVACGGGDDDDDSADDDDSSSDDDDSSGDDDDSAPAGYAFSTTDFGEYTRVDRIGMPAVATALISSENKDAYNAANPSDDVNGDFGADIVGTIFFLHHGTDPADGNTGLDDDLTGLGVTPCTALGDGTGTCVAQGAPLVFPDTLKIDTSAEAGFPNGRMLTDPVIDVTLAVLLLDLSVHTAGDLVGALNPAANDVGFEDEFPYLGAAH
ncbi:MAG: DUF4331 family protein [Myxococcota bacterium]|nr:DUF4331 family protein [Myxococcota bacterium]